MPLSGFTPIIDPGSLSASLPFNLLVPNQEFSLSIPQNLVTVDYIELTYIDNLLYGSPVEPKVIEYQENSGPKYIVWAKPYRLYAQQNSYVTSLKVTRTSSKLSNWSGPEVLVSNLGAGHGKFVDISYGDTLLLEFTLADGYILCNSGYSYNSSTKVYSTAVVVSSDLTFTPTAVTYTGPVNPQVRPGMGEYTEEVWFKATNNNNEQLRLVVNFTSLHVYQYDLGHDTDVAPRQSFWDIPANTTRDNMTVIWLGMDGGKWYSYEYEAHFEKEVRTGYGNWVQCSPSTYVSWSS